MTQSQAQADGAAQEYLQGSVERVSQGEEIIVTRMGHPVARITRYDPAASNRRLGFFEGRIRLAADFDDWPEDIARDLGITD